MGILSGHVPTLEALNPGLVEVIEGGNTTKKWFSQLKNPLNCLCLFIYPIPCSFSSSVSSGFASVHPNNSLTINAVEAYDIADFDASVRFFFFSSPPSFHPVPQTNQPSNSTPTQAVKSSLAAAKQTLGSTTSDYAKAEAQIEIDVLTVLEAAVKA